MALERTGNHPVDVLDCPDRNDVIEDLLVDHMHHIRSLYYPRVLHLAPLSRSAPRLETLGSNARSVLDIRNDFLGGTVGRLKKLQLRVVSFPEICPALSTVTELFLHGPTSFCNAMSFSQLFQLVPALQSLTLLDLKQKISEYMPAGPPPESLRYLNLATIDGEYDLTQLYAAWRSDRTAHDEISHDTAVSKHVVHFVEAAHTIDVQRDDDTETSVITVTGPGPRCRRLEYWEDTADQRGLAAHLLDIPSALRSVRAMSVPASSLEPFLAVFTVLPELKRITLVIDAPVTLVIDAPDAPAAASSWDVLKPLARLDRCRNLQSLVLQVDYVGAPCEPSAQDAEGLLAQLATLSHVPLPDITVTGFPPAVLHELPPAEFSAFRIVFGSTDEPADAQATIYSRGSGF